jgi:hypothetical protein
MNKKYEILILGASYGSLFGIKLALAGHNVKLVCLPNEVELINKEGVIVRLPFKGEEGVEELRSLNAEGNVTAAGPSDVNPSDFDLICLAMQEPQYGVADVASLLSRIAKSAIPCMSIMNMPPLPYLARIENLKISALHEAFTKPDVWSEFNPDLVTLCSPDPQAFRPPDEPINVLQVGLPTNFKVASFASEENTKILRNLQRDIESILYKRGQDSIELPVKLKVHDSLFVPLAKWSMLLAGNYRCVQENEARSIKEAVHSDIEKTESIYNWVGELARDLGASSTDQVPFVKYAKAAESLIRPSSAARALFSGAKNIERVDRLVRLIALQMGKDVSIIDNIIETVDRRLEMNRKN